MGRHAASDSSTVSPPRSVSEALRDTPDHSLTGPRSTGSRTSIIDSPVSAADLIARFRDSYAPANRTSAPSRASVSGINDRTPGERSAAPVLLNRAAPVGAVDPALSIAPVAVARIPAFPKQLISKPLVEKPMTAAAPVHMPAPIEAAGPLRVSDILARYQPANPAVATLSPSRRSGHHRPDPARSVSLPRLLPALRPLPSIRISVRPVLTIAAIIAAVALVEAPNLMSSSHAVANSGSRGQTSGAGTSTADTAAGDSTRYGHGGTGITTSSTAADQRVSRSARRAISVPTDAAAKAAAASHVPAMKPGQTVPGTWILPNGGPMTSCFCMRWGTLHAGIDLAGKLGSPILAVGDGTVIEAGPASGFGNWVVIQHANGDVSIYGHMRYFFVHKGQKVTAGEKIAVVGDQGFSTGPHLHFEVHKGGLAGPKIDPVPWLRARGITVGPLNKNG